MAQFSLVLSGARITAAEYGDGEAGEERGVMEKSSREFGDGQVWGVVKRRQS